MCLPHDQTVVGICMLELDHIISIKGVDLLAYLLCISSFLFTMLDCCVCVGTLLMSKLLLLGGSLSGSDMTSSESSHKVPSSPLIRKK